jgi:hypothetical protein
MRPIAFGLAVGLIAWSGVAAKAWEPPKARDFFDLSKSQDKRPPKAAVVYETYAKPDWGANWRQTLIGRPYQTHSALRTNRPYTDPDWGASWGQTLIARPYQMHSALRTNRPYTDPDWGASWSQTLLGRPFHLHASLRPDGY